MPIPIVRIDEIKPDQLAIMIASGAAPMVAASEIKRLLDEVAALNDDVRRLEARCDTLAEREAEARSQHNETLKTLHTATNELEAMRVEYTALWTVVIAYMNTGGTSYATPEQQQAYSTLVRQAMQSRFWNQQSS